LGAWGWAGAGARDAAPAPEPPRAQRASGIIDTPAAREKSKLWEWIKLAF
jgi:hypothetical protein